MKTKTINTYMYLYLLKLNSSFIICNADPPILYNKKYYKSNQKFLKFNEIRRISQSHEAKGYDFDFLLGRSFVLSDFVVLFIHRL